MCPRPLEMLLHYKHAYPSTLKVLVWRLFDGTALSGEMYMHVIVSSPETILPTGADRIPEEQRRVMGLEVASGGMTSH